MNYQNSVSSESLTTLTLFNYGSARTKVWAFLQMGLAGGGLSQTDGLKFWKMLGTGSGGGFSLQPDFARYGLIGVWQNETSADAFFADSKLFQKFQKQAAEIWTVKLLPIKAHGLWANVNPFENFVEPPPNSPLAVLTRATINLNKARRFWQFVPGTSRELAAAAGKIASIGIGEAPFVRQATFSFWENEQAMRDFAYKSPLHREVIKLTRAENWYKEEMFARFLPVSATGTWNGRNPLAGLI